MFIYTSFAVQNFPSSPEVRTLPFNAAGGRSICGQGAKILHVSRTKKKQNRRNRSSVVTNSIKTLKKVVRIKKVLPSLIAVAKTSNKETINKMKRQPSDGGRK